MAQTEKPELFPFSTLSMDFVAGAIGGTSQRWRGAGVGNSWGWCFCVCGKWEGALGSWYSSRPLAWIWVLKGEGLEAQAGC